MPCLLKKELCYMDLVRYLIVEHAENIFHTEYVRFYYVTN
jgi:hypothetical protein